MDNVIIVTTINVPQALELYPDAKQIIVAGDLKTPHDDLRRLEAKLTNMVYLSPDDQKKLGYSSSELIGWNVIQRRNIALLEAIKLHPDVITMVDDDNLPVDNNYLKDVTDLLSKPFTGLAARGFKMFNVGSLFDPVFCHRGFPRELQYDDVRIKSISNAKVGVVAGLCLGDPDIDAIEREVCHTTITYMPDIFQHGIVTDQLSPFNSQNTSFVLELAPLMMCLPEHPVARYNDIWMSYIAERVMFDLGYCVHYGKPFVWQERNHHTFNKDINREWFGINNTFWFCNNITNCKLPAGDVITKLDSIYSWVDCMFEESSFLFEYSDAWLHDLEKVL